MGRIYKPNSKKHQTNEEESDYSDFQKVHYAQSQDDDRVVYLASDLNEHSVLEVIQSIFSLAKRNTNKPIYLIVSSYGGECDAMFGLFDCIKFVKCPIYTIGLGKIMSAAVLILASGQKGHRYIGANARVMLHSIWGGSYGNVFEQHNELEEMKRLQEQMEKRLAEQCETDVETIKNIMKENKDHYLTANEAVKFNLVDKIIS